MPRIVLIHALSHSIEPIVAAFARLWPEASLVNLLDDDLSAARARGDSDLTRRFVTLIDYAVAIGADAVQFTCSAFGNEIAVTQSRHPKVLICKPNTAMIDFVEAQAAGKRVGLLATFEPSLESMRVEFPSTTDLVTRHLRGALAALNRGDLAEHDRLVVDGAERFLVETEKPLGVIALAQFSMAHTASAIAFRTGLPVFTTPDSAVLSLRARFANK